MTVSKKRRKIRTRRRPSIHEVRRVRLAIECTPLERRRMKVLAASEDKTLNEFVLESVRMRFRRCSRSHIPNDETAKTLQDAEKGEGIVKFNTMEDFFSSLER